MKAAFAILLLMFIANTAHAANYDCEVTSSHTEVDKSEQKDNPYLVRFLAAKTATLSISKKGGTLELFDKNDKPIAVPEADGRKSKDVTTIELGWYQNKNNKKRKEVAFSNDNISITDDSYGSHFAVFVKESDIESKADELSARVWSASIGEPDDDSGVQSLFDNTNLNLDCKISKK